MQSQSIPTPLDLSTHFTDLFDNANETKAAELKFCAYPKSSLNNKNQIVSRLTDREHEKS